MYHITICLKNGKHEVQNFIGPEDQAHAHMVSLLDSPDVVAAAMVKANEIYRHAPA